MGGARDDVVSLDSRFANDVFVRYALDTVTENLVGMNLAKGTIIT